jgi:hypothetical protein
VEAFISDPAGIRTQDPYIKSVLLYQLSYGIDLFLVPISQVRPCFLKDHCRNWTANLRDPLENAKITAFLSDKTSIYIPVGDPKL